MEADDTLSQLVAVLIRTGDGQPLQHVLRILVGLVGVGDLLEPLWLTHAGEASAA